MTPTLSQIDALFDRLNDDEQLLLIDHLADRLDGGDVLLGGLQEIAWQFAGRNEFEADNLIPQGRCLPETWRAHQKRRDETLEGAIRLRALGRIAA